MEYFASLPPEELCAELNAKIEAYYSWILSTGRLARWRTAYNTYYGQRGSHSSSSVTAEGVQGELSFLMANEYRNLVQHLLVLAFQSRTSLEMVATNTDSKSKTNAYTAKGVIEYYRRDGKIDANNKQAHEISLIMDLGWIINTFDTMLGDAELPHPDKPGEIIRKGDIKSVARTPLDVITDVTRPQGHDNDWILIRDPYNKFDLAAQYPEMAEDLKAINRDLTRDALYRFTEQFSSLGSQFQSADIDVWTFYHKRTPSMPNGRMFQFPAASKKHLFDGPIPYRRLPGIRVCPSEQILSCLGYSNANDLLGLQDVMDALISIAVTNITATAGNSVWVKEGGSISYEKIAEGLNWVKAPNKPEVVELNKLPAELIPLMKFIRELLQSYSGVNAVARGNLEGKDLSGAAMALIQSMAIQFNSGLVQSVNFAAQECGNDILFHTQDFVKSPKIGMIIGVRNQYMVKEYSAEDFDGIQRCYPRQSNPMKDTTAGKMVILDTYKDMNALRTPADVTEVLDTGQLDSFTDPERNLKLAIDEENEALMRGEVPPVVFTNNHPAHFLSHASLFASPDDRKDPGLLARVQQHWDQHMMVWQSTPPATLMALNIPPFPAPIMPPPGPGGAPPPGGPPPPGNDPIGPLPGPGDVPVDQPGLPKNPMSGEKWNPTTGGLPQGAQ